MPLLQAGHIFVEKPDTAMPPRMASGSPAVSYVLRGRSFNPARIATDDSGNVYVAGTVQGDAALAKFDSAFRPVYAIFWGGAGNDEVRGLAVGPNGDIYVAGVTASPDFPIVRAAQQSVRGSSEGFITRLTPDGGFVYSTYFGGTKSDEIAAIAVARDGRAYFTGTTYSQDFPVTANAFQKTMAPATPFSVPTAAFVSMLSPTGQIEYSSYLGGTNVTCTVGGSGCVPSTSLTRGSALAVDSAGAMYVGGTTNTNDFPVTPGAFRTTCLCVYRSSDVFLTKMFPDGSGLAFSTYIPAESTLPAFSFPPGDTLSGLALDSSGNLLATGTTDSQGFPTTPGVIRNRFQNSSGAEIATFVLKLAADGTRLVYSTYLTSGQANSSPQLQTDAQGNAYLVGSSEPATIPVTSGAPTNGSDYLLKLNAEGTTLSYGARLPAGSAATALALADDGGLLLLGPSGFLSWFREAGDAYLSPKVLGISNAAAFSIDSRIAPGEIISIYGKDLGPAQGTSLRLNPDGRVSTELAGVRVTVNGLQAPITFAGTNQINAVVPIPMNTNQPAVVQVFFAETEVASIPMWLSPAVPAVFPDASQSISIRTAPPAAALNQNGTINSPDNPADPGSVISVFVNGLGRMIGISDGEVRFSSLPAPIEPVTVDSSEVLFIGQAPGIVAGVVQINFRLGPADSSRLQTYAVTAGGVRSSFTINVRP